MPLNNIPINYMETNIPKWDSVYATSIIKYAKLFTPCLKFVLFAAKMRQRKMALCMEGHHETRYTRR